MPIELQQILLCRFQPAVGPVSSERGPGTVQPVDVREARQGTFDPGKPVACHQQRYIEAFSIKAHQMAGAADPSECCVNIAGSAVKDVRKYWRTCTTSSSIRANPSTKATVPVPPARPVVSVSMKSNPSRSGSSPPARNTNETS